MVKLDRILRMLQEQRRELLDQLTGVDGAIAALASAGTSVADPRAPEPDAPIETAAGAIVATRVKPRRVLSDAHKQALVVSKRRAREVKEAAKGLAREKHDDSFVPAIGKRGDRQPPRLVRQPGQK